jgi:hypothetical protein
VGVNGPFRVIGCVFRAFYARGFERLIAIGEFLNTFIVHFLDGRKPLGVTRLAGAFRPYLPWIFAQLVWSGFIALSAALFFAVFAHVRLLTNGTEPIPNGI